MITWLLFVYMLLLDDGHQSTINGHYSYTIATIGSIPESWCQTGTIDQYYTVSIVLVAWNNSCYICCT